jgi:uncharacterized membrane protein (DUF4010 family)
LVTVEPDLLGLFIAALGGTAVGLERQWSGHAAGPEARFAGIRTFTLLGGAAGLSGWLWTAGLTAPAAVILAGLAGITVAAYVAASRTDVEGTTEVAALVVIAAGAVAGIGAHRTASGIFALTSLLLVEKSRLHAIATRIDDVGLRAGVRFAVMALVVLPILPVGPFGPFGGVRPREVWALVLFFSGLSFFAYIARGVVGAGPGYFVAGLLGGLVSSTNVTLTFARQSRESSSTDRALAFGAVAANAMFYPRVIIATAVLNVELLRTVLLYLIAPALVAASSAFVGVRRTKADGAQAEQIENPLQLKSALVMALIFQTALMIVPLAGRVGGVAGLWGFAALLGLADVDALTVSMARSAAQTTSLQAAAAAIAVGVLSNTALKLVVAIVLGSARFRKIAGGTLLLILAATATALVLLVR